MNSSSLSLRACQVALAFSLAGVAFGQTSEKWEQAALLLYNASSSELNELRAQSGAGLRFATYSKALENLHREPQSQERVAAARETLEQLAQSTAKDDIAVASRYYLARIPHLFSDPPQLDLAKRMYFELFDSAPSHFFGQLAFLKYMLLDLYSVPSDISLKLRLQAFEKLGQLVDIPDMKRNAHRTLGDAYLNLLGDKAKALEHLKRAVVLKSPIMESQADLLFTTSALAEELGDRGLALSLMEDFRGFAPTDPRIGEVTRSIDRIHQQIVAE